MTTHNTYQEAKIANPEFDIYVNEDDEYGTLTCISNTKGEYVICEPHEYCDSLSVFFEEGKMISKGDVLLTASGVITVRDAFRFNKGRGGRKGDNNRYILRAAALENQMNINKLEMQTSGEEEALGNIGGTVLSGSDFVSTKEVHLRDYQEKTLPANSEGVNEWNGEGLPPVGVECEFEYPRHKWNKGYYHGHTMSSGVKMNIIEYEGGHLITLGGLTKFRKPESPEAKEKRERLEAAYDLFSVWALDEDDTPVRDFKNFSSDKATVDDWLRVVDKTNYRKGAK